VGVDFVKLYKSRYEQYKAIYEEYKLDRINSVDIINLTGIDVYRIKQYINEVESCLEIAR
jgi:hypothetical protein